jgi:hypothetical protein
MPLFENYEAPTGDLATTFVTNELRSKRRQSADVVIDPDSSVSFPCEKRLRPLRRIPEFPDSPETEQNLETSYAPQNLELAEIGQRLELQLELERRASDENSQAEEISLGVADGVNPQVYVFEVTIE